MNPIALITSGLSLARSILDQRHERRLAAESIKAKADLAKQGAQLEQNLSDAEWQAVKAAAEGSTWKDEYSLIVATSFIPLLMLGTVYLAFTGDDRLLTGVVEGINALQGLGLDVGFVIEVAIFVGLGVSAWRRI